MRKDFRTVLVSFDNRMYIGTENLGNLKVTLFSSFSIFFSQFCLTIIKSFCSVLICNKVISKFEIKYKDCNLVLRSFNVIELAVPTLFLVSWKIYAMFISHNYEELISD